MSGAGADRGTVSDGGGVGVEAGVEVGATSEAVGNVGRNTVSVVSRIT
jgi:hypothetical protein